MTNAAAVLLFFHTDAFFWCCCAAGPAAVLLLRGTPIEVAGTGTYVRGQHECRRQDNRTTATILTRTI